MRSTAWQLLYSQLNSTQKLPQAIHSQLHLSFYINYYWLTCALAGLWELVMSYAASYASCYGLLTRLLARLLITQLVDYSCRPVGLSSCLSARNASVECGKSHFRIFTLGRNRYRSGRRDVLPAPLYHLPWNPTAVALPRYRSKYQADTSSRFVSERRGVQTHDR